MKRKRIITTITSSVILLLTGIVVGDDDWRERKEHQWRQSRLDVAPVNNPLYEEECGACHFAFQPGLLPADSWTRIMNTLDNHFDENAELDGKDSDTIQRYLLDNSSNQSSYKRSRSIQASLNRGSDVPLRITATRYFVRKHDELPNDVAQRNEEINSMSNCPACHRRAKSGYYDEDEIIIPGIGRWDD